MTAPGGARAAAGRSRPVDALRLYEAADLAERAAVLRQWPAGGEPADHELVGSLQFAADALRTAGAQLGGKPPPLGASPWQSALFSAVSTGVWTAAVVVGLLVVPDPAVPWRFAALITGGALLGMAARNALWRRRVARAGATTPPTLADLAARIRDHLDRFTGRLDPDHDEADAAAVKSIRFALLTLDRAERQADGQAAGEQAAGEQAAGEPPARPGR